MFLFVPPDYSSLQMMRWCIQLSYAGQAYCGWQKQPGDPSVQQTLEEAISMILRQPVEIIGCGRTDAGVHARVYTAHTDVEDTLVSDRLIYQINSVLPHDIAIHTITEVSDSFHARFSASERHYQYYLHFQKDPFLHDRSYYIHQHVELTSLLMQEAAALLLQYRHFKPFCKTGSDAEHYQCEVTESKWTFEPDRAVYSIKANRFLRGMVRLIVGACIQAGLGKIYVSDLKECLEAQSSLPMAWSVPPEGLFLENVTYPD